MFFIKQKTDYVLRISEWSSDVCSSDLEEFLDHPAQLPDMALLVDHQPFDLVKHWRMGLVAVVAIGAARHDQPDRRLDAAGDPGGVWGLVALLHRSDLHR